MLERNIAICDQERLLMSLIGSIWQLAAGSQTDIQHCEHIRTGRRVREGTHFAARAEIIYSLFFSSIDRHALNPFGA